MPGVIPIPPTPQPIPPTEEPPPMLDVHPPHHAVSTWRDFFIHVATICVGLLIAIGLEQTVEFFHHRHLAHQARELLLKERDSNAGSNDFNIFATQRHEAALYRDLAILHAIRNHTPVPPGPFILVHTRYFYLVDEWRKIHLNGTITYLTEDLRGTDYRYENQDAFMARADRSIEALNHAAAILRSEQNPRSPTFDSNLAYSAFIKRISDSHETLSEDELQKGFASTVERGNLTALTPPQLGDLEHAIQVALVDDDALLTYCYNIKRNLVRNPPK